MSELKRRWDRYGWRVLAFLFGCLLGLWIWAQLL